MTMQPSDLREWAKEELLDAVDAFIVEWKLSNPGWTADDLEALTKQRDRIAKLFKMEGRS
jgi:hypothetical protein